MKVNSYWLKSGGYSFLLRIVNLFISLGTFFLLVRLLSKEDFGVWALFTTITTLIELARNGLIQNALVRHIIASPEEEVPKVITASFVINGILTLASIPILIVLSKVLSLEWASPELASMFLYYILTTIFLLPFFQLQFIEQANFSFKGIFYCTITKSGFLFVYIALALILPYKVDLISLSQVQILTAIAGSFVAYFFTRKYIKFSKIIDKEIIKNLFNYGKYVFGTAISSHVFRSIDQIMLGSLVSTASVASYNVAIRITNIVEVPTATIATIIFPKGAEAMEKGGKGEAKRLYEKSVGAILAVLLPGLIMVLLFPEFILSIIASKEYLDAVPILQVTIFYSLFIPFGRQFGTILDAIGKPKLTFYMVLLTMTINIIANYIFIKTYGVIGAAYGTLTAHAIGFICSQIILNKELKVGVFKPLYYIFEFYKEAYKAVFR